MTAQINTPELWCQRLPARKAEDHKYTHGHAVIIGAAEMTGATRLAAEACARIGAGLTTVIAPEGSGEIYRRTLAAHVIVQDMEWQEKPVHSGNGTYLSIDHHFSDPRHTALLAGPGGGAADFFRHMMYRAWEKEHLKGIVLDAEAFTAWKGYVEDFNAFIARPTIVTPHQGEFEKVFKDDEYFGDVLIGDKTEQAKKAASVLDAIVILKGAETVISDGGRTVVNRNAPATLATAGTGDVLAGMITGLLAQGMEPFDAACAAVWMHGEAANSFGPGLVASDLNNQIPVVLRKFV